MADIDKTLKYYNENAQSFASGTVSVKFTEVQDKFLEKLNLDAYILDFGCGAGRDTKYFLSRGYQVDAVDGSEQLCRIASEYTGIKVRQMLFQELDEKEKYDGIWACASILHLPKKQLREVLKNMYAALKSKGWIYTSFKYGEFEGERNGRYFTSADSVLQICGNEETFDLQNLYRCCEIAREITMKDEWRVGRVIARPYIGKKKGEFKRTSNRHDYALKPTGLTTLNVLKDHGFDVIGVGKIHDIFCGEGITETHHSDSSVHGMEQTIEICKRDFRGLCFVNLVDFDALWGHRRNVEGYGKELEKFDKNLGVLLEEMRENDLLILTADHGNDPTYTGTDHTREYVPFIAYSKRMKNGGAIKDEDTFAVIGASVAENFGVPMPEGTIGHSVLKELM